MNQIQLHDTLSRKDIPLKPLNDNTVRIYTCGLTVYSHPHIGNWVAYTYWDVLVRLLKYTGYDVSRVQNITDVGHLTDEDNDAGEDKLEKGARSEGVSAWGIAKKYTEIADHEAYDLLKLLRPDHMPKATDYIQQQIDFVRTLESQGYTYMIENDGIYFDTSKLDDYGKLARLDIEGLKAGARIKNDNKRNITDFAVWKFSLKDQERDMEWESPWGVGFPGWHLECSVMARELLGDQIDIHTGGVDHIPVHHTNEIAQTEAVTKKPFSQIWLHNNHIKVDGGKMAKSLGNGYTLEDIQDKGFEPLALKIMILSSHYRTEGNFTWEILESAQSVLNDLQAWADLRFQDLHSQELAASYAQQKEELASALSDDLNTPKAMSILSKMRKNIEELGIDSEAIAKMALLVDALLGLDLTGSADITDKQKQLLKQRKIARKNKDWSQSDQLRDELSTQGIQTKDSPHGQLWSRHRQ